MDNSTPGMSSKLIPYIDGELPENERLAMEQQLAVDAGLKAELERLKMAREAIRQYGLKQDVTAIHQEMMNELQPPVKPITSARKIVRYSMSIAAGIIILLAGITAYNYFSLTSGKVFRENYIPYELSTTRGSSSEMPPLENLYREKKYKELITTSTGRPFTVEEDLLRGLSFTELGDDIHAIESYKSVISKNKAGGTSILQDEAEYYLALSYIRHKDYSAALKLLNSISNNAEHLYHERVSNKLIRQVKKL